MRVAECPERPGNSVSGVVGSSLGSGAASAPRDTGSSSISCTSVVPDPEVELVEPSPPSVSPVTGPEDPSLASDSFSSD